jgi:hypothetical protein
MNNYYDNFPDDRETRRKKKRKIYSNKDFILGTAGVMAKLFVSFVIFLCSLGIITLFYSIFMYLKDMIFILVFSAAMMIVTWVSSVWLKKRSNILKAIPIIVTAGLGYILSPYALIYSIIMAVFFLIVAFIALARLNLPEKLALSQTLIIVSCLIFCLFQILFFISVFNTPSAQQAKPVFMTVGIIWILLSVFILNAINVSRSSNGKLSKGLLRGNITLSILFAGLVLIVSNINSYKDFILNTLRNILAFLLSGSEESEMPIESPMPQGGGMDLGELAEESESSLFWEIMEKIFIVLAVIGIAFLLFLLFKALFKAIKKLMNNVFDYFKDNDAAEYINRYDDKEESTFDTKSFNDAIKKRWDKIVGAFKRKPKYSDMHDNRQRVRFLYKKILSEDEKKARPAKPSATPREYLFDGGVTIDKKDFIKGYEKARYSDHEVTDREVGAGLKIAVNKDVAKH